MIRRMSGVKLSYETKIGVLQAKLGLCDLRVVALEHHLRWFGRFMRSSGEMNKI